MDRSYWQKQTPEQPLYPDLLWSQPQQRSKAGKLLIVGGNIHGFAAAAEAYGAGLKAGGGSIRVILPSGLKKTVGQVFPEAEFAPMTSAGGLSSEALGVITEAADLADCALLAGDFGNNSETAILLEQFIHKYNGQLVVSGDTIDNFKSLSSILCQRPATSLVLNFSQLQKLITGEHFTQALVSSVDLLHMVELIHAFSLAKESLNILVEHDETIFVAVGGQVSTTKIADKRQLNLAKLAAAASVWWMQNPAKPFEALCVSAVKN